MPQFFLSSTNHAEHIDIITDIAPHIVHLLVQCSSKLPAIFIWYIHKISFQSHSKKSFISSNKWLPKFQKIHLHLSICIPCELGSVKWFYIDKLSWNRIREAQKVFWNGGSIKLLQEKIIFWIFSSFSATNTPVKPNDKIYKSSLLFTQTK